MTEARGVTERYGHTASCTAEEQLPTATTDPGMMHPWAGFALFTGDAAPAMAVAAYLLKRRDA